MAWTGPTLGSTLRNENVHKGGGMRNQRPKATKLANSRKEKKSSLTDTDVQMCYQPSRYWYPLLCTSSVFPKNQSISSTETYPSSAILWHVQIQLWPRTIIDWNSLPPDYLTMDSTVKSKAAISHYIFSVWCLPPLDLLYFYFYVS